MEGERVIYPILSVLLAVLMGVGGMNVRMYERKYLEYRKYQSP
jgi:hypothetical protein